MQNLIAQSNQKIKNQNMIQYLTTFLILIVALIYIRLIYLPRKNLLWYKNTYQALGYKVKTQQFYLFNLGFFLNYFKWMKQYGDPNYKLRTQEYTRYDIILNNAFSKIEITLTNPDLLKQFLAQEKIYIYPKSQIGVANLIRVFGDGIAFSQGNSWKRKRKIITHVFNHGLLVANIPKIAQIVEESFQQAEKKYCLSNEKKFVIRLNQIFEYTFFHVILRIFFGHDLKQKTVNGQNIIKFLLGLVSDANKQSFSPLGAIFGYWIYKLGLTKENRKLNNNIKLFENLGHQFITDRLNQIKKNGLPQNSTDITAELYKYQLSQNKQSDNSYDYKEFNGQFRTFLAAGTDTTLNLTIVMIYFIALNPDVEKKLRQQINTHIRSDSDITYENLKKLEYIDCIQKQVGRYYGPVNTIVPRIATIDNKIKDLPVKKGDIVNFLSLPIHFNPNYYKNPQQFRPQRWKEESKDIQPYKLVTFSGGPRTCIGRGLALLQNKIAILKFIRRYKSIKLPCNKINYVFNFLIEPQPMEVTLEKMVIALQQIYQIKFNHYSQYFLLIYMKYFLYTIDSERSFTLNSKQFIIFKYCYQRITQKSKLIQNFQSDDR